MSIRKILVTLSVVTVLVGGGLSWFASSQPDGLEWAIMKTSGKAEIDGPETGIHQWLADLQDRMSILPDYSFSAVPDQGQADSDARPLVNAGTSVSGLVGGFLTLLIAVGVGLLLRRRRSREIRG